MKDPERATQKSFQFGPFRLNPAGRALRRGRERVGLSSKAFDTLLVLIQHQGEVVDKNTLMSLVWPDTAVEENNLAQSIAAIRKALGEEPGGHEYVITVPGRGYSFACPVTEALPETPAIRQPQPLRLVDAREPPALRRKWVLAIAVGLLLVALTAFVLTRSQAPAALDRARRFPLVLPEGIGDFKLSPDGEKLLFMALQTPECRIYSFASGESRPVPALNHFPGAAFWSPDSRWIGFIDGHQIRKMDLASGAVSTIYDSRDATSREAWDWSPAWAPDGGIFFSVRDQGIMRIPPEGGGPVRLTKIVSPARFHLGVQPLPGGQRFLFYSPGVQGRIQLGSVDGKPPVALAAAGTAGIYAAPGYLLYVLGDVLMAQPFDPAHGVLAGPPKALIDGVARLSPAGPPHSLAQISVSQTGLLVYRPGTRLRPSRLIWFDRSGNPSGTVGDLALYSEPALSPDGNRLAVNIVDPQAGKSDIWILDLVRGGRSRLTFGGSDHHNAVWSPDGSRIAFTSDRKGVRGIYVKDANGTAPEELVLATATPKFLFLDDWSRDGAVLAYTERSASSETVGFLPLSGRDRKPTLFPGEGTEAQAQLSPDGKFVAFRTHESGRYDIFIQALAPGGGRWHISTTSPAIAAGGPDWFQEPQWRGDGKELYYMARDALMAVDIKVTGEKIVAGIPHVLFALPRVTYTRNRYAAARDGRRFLAVIPEKEDLPPPIVVENWPALLKIE